MRALVRGLAVLLLAGSALAAQAPDTASSADPRFAVDTLAADLRGGIDKAAAQILEQTGAPSASIAVVRDGTIAYLHAYGRATLDPPIPAQPSMRYSIGSI